MSRSYTAARLPAMTEPINTLNAVPDEDDNPEQHTGNRTPDHNDTESGEQPAAGEDKPA